MGHGEPGFGHGVPPSTIDIGQPLLLPSPPGIVIAVLVYYDFPSAHSEHARRGDKGRHCHDCEDRGQLTPGGQQDAPQHRAQHRAQAADATSPAHTGGPAGRRIVGGGQGVDPDLAAPGAEPGVEHGGRHEPGHRSHVAEGDDERARQRVGNAKHAVRIGLVHDPAERHAAQYAARIEQGGDQRRRPEGDAGAVEQRRQPVPQQIEEEQAHEEGEPEEERPHPQVTAEELAHRELLRPAGADEARQRGSYHRGRPAGEWPRRGRRGRPASPGRGRIPAGSPRGPGPAGAAGPRRATGPNATHRRR